MLVDEGAGLRGVKVGEDGAGFLMGLLSCTLPDVCEGRFDGEQMGWKG